MLSTRLKQLKKEIKKQNLDGVLISSVSTITYLTGYANFSIVEREAYLIVGKDFQYIITDGRYSEHIKVQVPHFTLFERGAKSRTEDLLKILKKDVKSLGIEEDNLTVSEHKIIKKHFKNIKHFEINNLRSIKTDEEVDKIKQAAKIGDEAFNFIIKELKIGVTEKEIAFKLESFIRSKGAEISFPSIVAFGKNSAIPHHQTGNTKLGPESSSGQEGQIVLLDFGAKVENYCSDTTRTFVFGKADKKQKEIFEIVLEAQQKAVEFINQCIKNKKEIKADEVDKVAREYIKSKGYPDIPHSLGHGIGLEVHEHPFLSFRSKEGLKEGMVFSIEPGIYIPKFGGVRIEDLFVYKKDGLEQITNALLRPTLPSY